MQEFDLHKHPKITSGFKTPERYFDDFQEKIISNLPEDQPKTVAIRSLWIYAAAAVLIVALTIPVYYALQKPTSHLDTVAVENYLTQHTAISDHDFAELLDEEDIAKIKTDSNIEAGAIEEVLSTNVNLEEYLIN